MTASLNKRHRIPRCLVGFDLTSKSELDTPCLVVDLDVMEHNILDMANSAKDGGVLLRPMEKTHRCPAIGNMQVAAGAIGLQTATVGEAQVMVAGGIKDVFISNEIVDIPKIERMIGMSKRTKISTSVDSVVGARILSDVALKHGTTLDVLIHVDTGNLRTGVLPMEPTLSLAKEVVKLKGIKLKGIWTHEGQNYTGKTVDDVNRITQKAGEDMVNTKKLLEKELGVKIYNSVGSTPGGKPLAKMRGVDEVRPGAYVFYDGSQIQMGVCTVKDCALAVLTTVVSKPAKDRIVNNAGSKSYYPPGEWLAFEKDGLHVNWPLPASGGGIVKTLDGKVLEDTVFQRWGEEYGIMKVYNPRIWESINIGDKVEVIPYHICSTVNLHDEIIGIRNGEVEVILPVWARGKSK